MQTDNKLFDKHMRLVRELPVGASRGGQDRDHVVELCDEVVRDGHSCLIFCATKKNCEVRARARICRGRFAWSLLGDTDFWALWAISGRLVGW